MSILDDLEGPFESFGATFKTLFTDPGKLKAKDIPTLVLPIPGVGSTITYDLDHPQAAVTQGAAVAGGAGLWRLFGPEILNSYAPEYASSLVAAPSQDALAAQGSYLFGAGVESLPADPAGIPPLLSNAPGAAGASYTDQLDLIGKQIESGQVWNADTAAEIAATQNGVGEAASSYGVKALAKDVSGFVVGTATVSNAIRGIAGQWSGAIDKVKSALGVGGSGSAGRPTIVGGGGASASKGAAPAALASSSSFLMIGLVVSAASWILYKLWKGGRK